MSETAAEIAEKANVAFGQLQSLMDEIKEAQGGEADRFNNLSAKADELGNEVATLKQAQADAEAKEAAETRVAELETRITDLGQAIRNPSKAGAILGEKPTPEASTDQFFLALALAQSPRTDAHTRQLAEKALLDMGSVWKDVPSESKATLGETDANGGFMAPRAVVAELSKVAVANNPYRSLLTVVSGIVGNTVDIPHRGLAPARAIVVARGATKTNVDMSLTNYTATFYTLAKIQDAAVQWLRQTRGAGEALIRQELGEAMALGESYYILNGSGTSEPKGLLTSIGTSGTFVTSHTAAQTTIAGNIASGLAKAAGDLAGRSRVPDGAVMNATDFWITLASGDDDAGFYVSPAAGATSVNATGAFSNGGFAISYWGIPIVADPNMPADSLVVGQWKAAQLYLGDGYRVDTSSEAGDRWDKNLTGFRAEEEIAFNADPYVSAGLFQRLIDTKA